MAICLFTIHSKAQTYDRVLLDDSSIDGAAKIEYTLDSNKVLHFRITAESYTPFAADPNTYENQVILRVGSGASDQFFIEFNEEDFPFGTAGVYTGSFDLSAYSLSEISEMEIDGGFDFRINNYHGDNYDTYRNFHAYEYIQI
jgi:hypothetical protein